MMLKKASFISEASPTDCIGSHEEEDHEQGSATQQGQHPIEQVPHQFPLSGSS